MLLHRSALGRKCGQVNASKWPEFCRAIHKMMDCQRLVLLPAREADMRRIDAAGEQTGVLSLSFRWS